MFKKIKSHLIKYYIFHHQLQDVMRLFKIIKPIKNGKGLIIIPCDPYTVTGSRGDEAMITVAIQHFRSRHPKEAIFILCSNKIASDNILRVYIDENVSPVECWNTPYPVRHLFKQICKINPAEVIVIGADCMDGAYAPNQSLELLSLYNLSINAGIKTALFGFSYNASPYKSINKAFRKMNNSVYNLRDSYSLERFNQFTHLKGCLVADSAFLLKPRTDFEAYNEIKLWIDNLHSQGQLAIAFNFHPMLRKYSHACEIVNDAKSVAENLVSILRAHSNVNFLLLPHDDRNHINDMTMLDVINTILLESGFVDRIMYLRDVPRASHLKAISALMDGVISSRMHLAIASLGSEVPVLVADYQDKFKGLLKHFNIPNDYVLSISDFCGDSFQHKFNLFIGNLPNLKTHVRQYLPTVIALAQNNLKMYSKSLL